MLTVVVSGPTTSPEYLPVRVADAAGLFAREGVAVALKTTRAEVGAAEALAQAQADLAATSLESMLRFGSRYPQQAPRVVFGLTAAPPVALLVSRASAGTIRRVADLRGRRIGFAAPGATEHTWLMALIDRAGLKPPDVELLALGMHGLVTSLENGEIEAGVVVEPYASRLLAGGQAALLVDLRTPEAAARALGRPTLAAAVFARADRIPPAAALTGVTRALLAAETMLRTMEPDALMEKVTPAVVGAPEEFRERVLAARALYLADGRVTAPQIDAGIAVLREYMPLPITLSVPKASEMLHLAPFTDPRPRGRTGK